MDEYTQKSLLTLNSEPNATNTIYFSNKNMDYIQTQLILQTRKSTGYTISKQNCNNINMAMMYFYVNYPQIYQGDDVKQNIRNLNEMVIDDLTKQTVSGVKQHMEYLNYIKRKPEPLEYGKSTTLKGNNSLQYFDSFTTTEV